jgi:hypothetical protein
MGVGTDNRFQHMGTKVDEKSPVYLGAGGNITFQIITPRKFILCILCANQYGEA